MQFEMAGTIVVAIAASGPAARGTAGRMARQAGVTSSRWRAAASRPREHAVDHESSDVREVEVMEAHVGDRLVILSRHLDEHLRSGEIVEVHGAHGAPPYVVRWAGEERTALVFPGPDAHVEPAPAKGGART